MRRPHEVPAMTRPAIFRKLRADHRRVLAALDALEREVARLRPAAVARSRASATASRSRPLPTRSLSALVAHLDRQFATHMAAEDDSLFPSLAGALPETAGSLEPLRAEHAELRAILGSLSVLLEAPRSEARDEQLVVQWRDFAALLRIHIRKEEALVFNVAEHALPPRELARVEAIRFPRRATERLRPNLQSGKVPSMKRMMMLVALLILGSALASCGGPSTEQSSTGGGSDAKSAATSGASSGSSVAAVSKYDSGPRAGESPADEALARTGEELFKNKGCSACHAFGKRVTGPDLAGVSMRRTSAWIENQILHPEVMVKEDPIARGLFAQFALQMPNQGVKPEEARALIEYFKHTDHEAGEPKAESHE